MDGEFTAKKEKKPTWYVVCCWVHTNYLLLVVVCFVEHNISRVCMYVCVVIPFILDIKFVGRTSRGHTGGMSHRIFHPPSFCGACLHFYREKDSAVPFPRRP